MFARAARVTGRKAALRRVAYVSGPLLLIYSLGPSPLRSDSSRAEQWSSKAQPAPPKSQDATTGPFQSLRQRFSRSDAQGSTNVESSDAPWAVFSQKFSEAGDAIGSFEWSSIGDRISEFIVPKWASSIPLFIRKLQDELDGKPGSLADEILQEAADPSINPEVAWTARVRVGKELCPEELEFQRRRRKHIVGALAQYLDIPEQDIHPDDVPVIAMCGSGGGLRALVAGANSSLCAQEDGLFDCVMYTAGVSGSCWMQALYHSSMAHQDFKALLNHLKRRIGVHIAFPPPALNLLASAPTNKYLLAGLLEKAKGDPHADFGLVDIYGLLLAARLLVPRGELEVDPQDLKISHQRANIDDGRKPLPIYTAVRHEIAGNQNDSDATTKKHKPSEGEKQKAQEESWFQWFEWTPYEFWCEEIDAGIPSWSLGRIFRDGVSVRRDYGLEAPEMRLPQLMGIWGSAFCATLSHYYKEIQPLVKGLTGFHGIDELIEERDADMVKVHPIDPASIPNFAMGLGHQLPANTPPSIVNDSHLQLMDAGMSNNLPIYPLLRPGRDVDVLIAFDASADPKKDNWLAQVDGYARQRGIAGWPMGAGWPPIEEPPQDAAADLADASGRAADDAAAQLDADSSDSPDSSDSTEPSGATAGGPPPQTRDLGHCTIWVGSTQERTMGADDRADAYGMRIDGTADAASDWEPLEPTSGLAVVYFPLIPNPQHAPGIDPATAPYLSTWNFIYTPEDIDAVGRLARANWEEGRAQTRRCVRAVYERKKRNREAREREARDRVWKRRWRDGDGLV